VVPPLHTSQRERAEDYGSVIVRLGDRHRVIECSGGIQWIVQRKRGQQWHGLSYHLNRDVLIEHCKRHGAGEDAIATLQALPTRHGYVEEASSTSTESFLVRNPDEALGKVDDADGCCRHVSPPLWPSVSWS